VVAHDPRPELRAGGVPETAVSRAFPAISGQLGLSRRSCDASAVTSRTDKSVPKLMLSQVSHCPRHHSDLGKYMGQSWASVSPGVPASEVRADCRRGHHASRACSALHKGGWNTGATSKSSGSVRVSMWASSATVLDSRKTQGSIAVQRSTDELEITAEPVTAESCPPSIPP
jgi:hypothetical protein